MWEQDTFQIIDLSEYGVLISHGSYLCVSTTSLVDKKHGARAPLSSGRDRVVS